MAGFEPAASRSQSERATRLRYIPFLIGTVKLNLSSLLLFFSSSLKKKTVLKQSFEYTLLPKVFSPNTKHELSFVLKERENAFFFSKIWERKPFSLLSFFEK